MAERITPPAMGWSETGVPQVIGIERGVAKKGVRVITCQRTEVCTARGRSKSTFALETIDLERPCAVHTSVH